MEHSSMMRMNGITIDHTLKQCSDVLNTKKKKLHLCDDPNGIVLVLFKIIVGMCYWMKRYYCVIYYSASYDWILFSGLVWSKTTRGNQGSRLMGSRNQKPYTYFKAAQEWYSQKLLFHHLKPSNHIAKVRS